MTVAIIKNEAGCWTQHQVGSAPEIGGIVKDRVACSAQIWSRSFTELRPCQMRDGMTGAPRTICTIASLSDSWYVRRNAIFLID